MLEHKKAYDERTHKKAYDERASSSSPNERATSHPDPWSIKGAGHLPLSTVQPNWAMEASMEADGSLTPGPARRGSPQQVSDTNKGTEPECSVGRVRDASLPRSSKGTSLTARMHARVAACILVVVVCSWA